MTIVIWCYGVDGKEEGRKCVALWENKRREMKDCDR